jgi:hypothetical protein
MKKTIIAAAIAAVVAAPAAMAEVSISGQINQEFTNDSDDSTNAANGRWLVALYLVQLTQMLVMTALSKIPTLT